MTLQEFKNQIDIIYNEHGGNIPVITSGEAYPYTTAVTSVELIITSINKLSIFIGKNS